MSEFSNTKRFLFGCLGAAALVAANFLASGPDLAVAASPIFYVGYLLRVLFLILLGGIATWMLYTDTKDAKLLFHLGMSMPAILIAVTPSGSFLTEPSRRVLPVSAFVTSALAQGSEAQKSRKKQEPQMPKAQEPSEAAKRQDSEFIRGLAGVPRTANGEQESRFRMIFFSLLALTIFSALANVFLAITESTSKRIDGASEGFSTTWKLGFGAIVGLISGRAL